MQTHSIDPKMDPVLWGMYIIFLKVFQKSINGKEMIAVKIPKDLTKKVINTLNPFLTAHASNLGGLMIFLF